MVIIIIGTRAQLIKMAPVMLELECRGIQYKFVLTGQHKDTIEILIEDFNIKEQPEYLYKGAEITGIVRMAVWFSKCLIKLIKNRKDFLSGSDSSKSVIIVHGDTVSTLMGAIFGRIADAKVVHIESGLRSYNVFHPFPEEITRILTFYLTDIAFCPGNWASRNMEKYKLESINTIHNTILDSVNRMLDSQSVPQGITLTDNYCVCSIHRFENIFFRKRLGHIINLIEHIATIYHLVFILHPATKNNLVKFGLLERLEKNPAIDLRPRSGYRDFIHQIFKSRFVITDGGSNQEELSYLGKPVLLMRKVTERQDGLNCNIKICNYDKSVIDDFMENIESYSVACDSGALSPSPSSIIVDKLIET